MKNKVKELTPKEFKCAGLGCPSVFSNEENELYIIGKITDESELPSDVKKKIGKDEFVVKVPKGLISKIEF